jgi:hypothetical protein
MSDIICFNKNQCVTTLKGGQKIHHPLFHKEPAINDLPRHCPAARSAPDVPATPRDFLFVGADHE